VVGFFFVSGLAKASVMKQMERLLALWPVVEQQSSLVAGGAMFERPMKSLSSRQI
jgi:hypothetical protein